MHSSIGNYKALSTYIPVSRQQFIKSLLKMQKRKAHTLGNLSAMETKYHVYAALWRVTQAVNKQICIPTRVNIAKGERI